MSVRPPCPVIDAHTHFFPDRMFAAIWDYFERGRWMIAHQRPVDSMPGVLASYGVEHYTLLNYVKQPGQAESLNAWTAEFAAAHPEAIALGTVHAGDPDPWATVAPYLEDDRFVGIKLQPLVSRFGVDDPRLAPVMARLEALDKILVVHAGSAPYANKYLGLSRLERVLEAHPNLRVVCAHMGAYEIDLALELLERFPGLHLDTAMIWVDTDAFETDPGIALADLERISDRVLFGSDYPNVPYPYSESIASVTRLGLSEDALRKIFHENASRVFGIS